MDIFLVFFNTRQSINRGIPFVEPPIYQTEGFNGESSPGRAAPTLQDSVDPGTLQARDRTAGNYGKHEEHVGNLAEHVGICGQKLENWWQKVGDWWQSCCFWVQHMYFLSASCESTH
jgi:hypothetical protein